MFLLIKIMNNFKGKSKRFLEKQVFLHIVQAQFEMAGADVG